MGKIAWQRWLHWLWQPQDIMPLVFFRVAFGGIMLWEVWRYFHYDRIWRYYIAPEFTFPYTGFHWLTPLPGDGMIWLFHGLGVLSFCILVGAAYRVVMPLFALLFTYVFLLDEAQYLNHFYLISLVSVVMVIVPAHRKWSVDAWLRPAIHTEVAPQWALWLLRAQMAIVYIYGGIAKINPDWLRGEPMRDWLRTRTDFPIIGQFFTDEWVVYGFSYGGLLFDLLVVPLLLWKRTRWLGIVWMLTFHLMNARLFNIGIFPFFAIVATLLFLPPHWFRLWESAPAMPAKAISLTWRQIALTGIILLYIVWQIVLPLRHFVYEGYVSWTEAGHTLAWHMKLRQKEGSVLVYASDTTTGITQPVPAETYLTPRQYEQMTGHPSMIYHFVQYLGTLPAYQGQELRIWAMTELNLRASQLLIDPTVNLAEAGSNSPPSDWVLPLMQPPSPQAAVPTLLISRRVDGRLLFINITEVFFPLAGLYLYGETQSLATMSATDALAADDCLLAQEPNATSQSIFPICNEAAQRLPLPSDVLEQAVPIRTTNAYDIQCRPAYCLVTYTDES